MFIRRRVITEMGLFFDTRWRVNGDMWWLLEATSRGLRMGVMPRFTSVYADTGDNLNLGAAGDRERQQMAELIPPQVRRLKQLILLHHKCRLLMRGVYTQKPFDYSLYTFASPARRLTQHVAHPTGLWRGRYRLLSTG
jgi:hypothetical protein